MLIRDMKREDINQVYEIECESFSEPWTENALYNELSNPNAIYLVISKNEEVIAYAGMWKIFDEGHITNIAVKKIYRQNGFGRLLTEKLIEKGTSIGVSKYTLEVRESNTSAIKMYRKIGFKEVGIRKDFYDKPRENAYIMWYGIE
jgi:ribosomal-protein-alanine N-acetyltransferase